MRKPILLIICILLPFFSSIISANVVVSPAEISIDMKDGFQDGNFSGKITVFNQNSFNVSVKTFMKHPDIIEWMRFNRTFITNLSWINIEPTDMIILPNESADFYINLTIPKEFHENLLDQHWETWAAVKVTGTGSNIGGIQEGYLIRFLVDTPSRPVEFNYLLYLLTIPFILFLIVLIYFIKKSRK